MHTSVFEKHDAAGVVGVVNAAGADGAVDAEAAVGVAAVGVVIAAAADGAAAGCPGRFLWAPGAHAGGGGHRNGPDADAAPGRAGAPAARARRR